MDKNSAIVLMNHHYELDWCFGWMVADRFKVLGTHSVENTEIYSHTFLTKIS